MACTFTAWFGQASQMSPDSCSGENGSSIQHTVKANNAFQDTTSFVGSVSPWVVRLLHYTDTMPTHWKLTVIAGEGCKHTFWESILGCSSLGFKITDKSSNACVLVLCLWKEPSTFHIALAGRGNSVSPAE